MELRGNHRVLRAGPVSIGCMDPQARSLMDRALDEYGRCRRKGPRENVRNFMTWLFKESGLVADLQEQALPAWRTHFEDLQRSLQDHPNPKWRREHSRESVYGFAYWFFRWSGLITPEGKAVE